MVRQLDLRVRPEGYYYTPWYNVFVAQLLSDSESDFMAHMLYTAARDLEAEGAKKLDFRQKMREERRRNKALDTQLQRKRREYDQLRRKFSKVEWVYKLGRAMLRLPRKIKKAFAADK